MAGHSHSANIKHRKNAVDAKRAKIFSKLARHIISAARQGGADVDTNLKLKYAVEKAKAANMPKDGDAETLAAYRFDRWCLKHWQDWRGEILSTPACVVRPRDTSDVQTVVRYATSNGIPIIPWGWGSGVCGGIEPTDTQILMDMSTMNQVLSIDEENLLLTVEAGINGLVAEEAAAERGLTIGHWPQSIAISSVGGWISTRASGQFSTAYGNIEDIVYSLERWYCPAVIWWPWARRHARPRAPICATWRWEQRGPTAL